MACVPVCKCGEKGSYCEKHDAYYCKACDVWLEPKCCKDGEECDAGFCTGRPEKPSQVEGE